MLDLLIDTPDAPEGLRSFMDRITRLAFGAEEIEEADVCVRLLDDEAMRALNAQSRGIDQITDVLSFPMVRYPRGTARENSRLIGRERDPETGRTYLGDIAISLPRARAQAAEYGHSLERELGYLTAHAVLHLMGYDHERDGDKRIMRDMEEQIMLSADLTREPLPTDEELFALACGAMANAYVPYSNFKVGACVRSVDGRVFTGCNIENAAYSPTICAERTAIAKAVSEGARNFTAIAIAAERAAAWPCGVCRQVIKEFSAPGMRVIVGQAGEGFEVVPFAEIFPRSFGPEALE